MNKPHNPLIKELERRLHIQIVEVKTPPQGMDSEVFFVKTKEGDEYAVKFGVGAMGDKVALKLINKNDIGIPVPKVFQTFNFNDKPVLVLERINYPLLESVKGNRMGKYIPSMIENLRKIHTIKSDRVGYITNPSEKLSWKEFLLSNFTSSKPRINWTEVSKREFVDAKVLLDSVERIVALIEKTEFISENYSLLHTDFNQRNLFIDPDSNQIASIIDWGEAMFGDPMYDFARIKMLIWHFNVGAIHACPPLEETPVTSLFTEEEKKLEQIYRLHQVIEYIAWYSEKLTEFNIGRIKLHQDFLRSYEWKK